jgi:flagellar basal body-associated protein FliL
MAEEKEAEAPRAAGGIMKWLLTAVVGLGSAGAGFAVPHFLSSTSPETVAESSHKDASSKKKHEGAALAYVPFGDVVANLDDHRMMRYVRAKFALSVEKEDSEAVHHLVDENKLVLKNWLIGYLQNKQISEVRGTEGFNRLCREIQEHFNQSLFPDGEEKINEILFEEFNVQ